MGTAPLEVIDERRRAGRLVLPAPTHDQRVQQRLALGPRVQEVSALGRVHPFANIAREVGVASVDSASVHYRQVDS